MHPIHHATRPGHTRRHGDRPAWLLAGLLIAGFALISVQINAVIAGDDTWLGGIDHHVHAFFVGLRAPALTGVAINVTALGSVPGISILTLILFAFLALRQQPRQAVQQLLAMVGAVGLTAGLKLCFERPRPDISLRLVTEHGFSFPSGHSLDSAAVYVTCTILAARQLRGLPSRAVIWALFLSLVAAIGATRMYLGVHYFSDVTAGIMLGAAWAVILDSVMNRLDDRFQWTRRI